MRLIPRTELAPHHCAVFPHLGAAQQQGYFDTTTDYQTGSLLNRVYVSVVAVQEMARQLGWHTPDELLEATRERDALQAELAKAEGQRDALQRQLDAIHVLKSAGFTPARKPGRKPKEKSAA